MKTHLKALFSFLLFTGIVPATSPALSQERVALLGDWEVTQAFNDEGGFEVCSATRSYPNGEAVAFYADENFLTLGFLLERWVLDVREDYEIAVQFDDNFRNPGLAIKGDDPQTVLINIDFSPSIEEIQTSGNLYLHTAAGSLRFDLEGVEEAFAILLQCRLDNLPEGAE